MIRVIRHSLSDDAHNADDDDAYVLRLCNGEDLSYGYDDETNLKKIKNGLIAFDVHPSSHLTISISYIPHGFSNIDPLTHAFTYSDLLFISQQFLLTLNYWHGLFISYSSSTSAMSTSEHIVDIVRGIHFFKDTSSDKSDSGVKGDTMIMNSFPKIRLMNPPQYYSSKAKKDFNPWADIELLGSILSFLSLSVADDNEANFSKQEKEKSILQWLISTCSLSTHINVKNLEKGFSRALVPSSKEIYLELLKKMQGLNNMLFNMTTVEDKSIYHQTVAYWASLVYQFASSNEANIEMIIPFDDKNDINNKGNDSMSQDYVQIHVVDLNGKTISNKLEDKKWSNSSSFYTLESFFNIFAPEKKSVDVEAKEEKKIGLTTVFTAIFLGSALSSQDKAIGEHPGKENENVKSDPERDAILQLHQNLRESFYDLLTKSADNNLIVDADAIDRLKAFLIPPNGIGFPSSIRRHIWECALSRYSSAPIESEDYQRYISPFFKLSEEAKADEAVLIKQLEVDLPRCHQYSKIMQSKKANDEIIDIITAWSRNMRGSGHIYWQGMDSICSLLYIVFNGNRIKVYKSLCLITTSPTLCGLFVKNNSSILNARLKSLAQLLLFHDPTLARILQRMQLFPNHFAIPWILTLFAHTFPADNVSRLWDCLLFPEVFKTLKNENGESNSEKEHLFMKDQEIVLAYLLFCISVIVQVRGVIMTLHDFTDAARFLSRLPVEPLAVIENGLLLTTHALQLTPCLDFFKLAMNHQSANDICQYTSPCVDFQSMVDYMRQNDTRWFLDNVCVVDARSLDEFNQLRFIDSVHADFPKVFWEGEEMDWIVDNEDVQKFSKQLQIWRLSMKKKYLFVFGKNNTLSQSMANFLGLNRVPFVCALLFDQPLDELLDSHASFFQVEQSQ